MTHSTPTLDQYSQLTRAVLMSSVLEAKAISAAIDRMGGTDMQSGTTDQSWWVKWRGHEVSLHFPASTPEEVVDVIPFTASHQVASVLTVNVNDGEAEAIAWHLVSSLITADASWYDGERMVSMSPTGLTSLNLDHDVSYPVPLWNTIHIALGAERPLHIDSLAAAFVATPSEDGWSEVHNDQYRLQLRLIDADALPDTLHSTLADNRRTVPAHWLEVLAHGPHGYAAAAEVARRVAKAERDSLIWVDQGGNTGSVTESSVLFDNTPLPDALMYLKHFASEWELANLLVPIGAERIADEQGRNSWTVPVAQGQVVVTLERDGVVNQMNSSGATAWLSRFNGKAGSIVLFQCGPGITVEMARPIAEVISESYENYWLPRDVAPSDSWQL